MVKKVEKPEEYSLPSSEALKKLAKEIKPEVRKKLEFFQEKKETSRGGQEEGKEKKGEIIKVYKETKKLLARVMQKVLKPAEQKIKKAGTPEMVAQTQKEVDQFLSTTQKDTDRFGGMDRFSSDLFS